MEHLLFASADPQRAELLAAAGFTFDLMPVHIDEPFDIEETPDGYARRVALLEARAVAELAEGRLVVAAKTVVLVDGEMLGKPHNTEEARRMLRLLSGREHDVITAVCAIRQSRSQIRIDRTRVQFAVLTDEEVNWYVATGESAQREGAYLLHGKAARFVTRIEGSCSNAMGLPVSVVYQMCRVD